MKSGAWPNFLTHFSSADRYSSLANSSTNNAFKLFPIRGKSIMTSSGSAHVVNWVPKGCESGVEIMSFTSASNTNSCSISPASNCSSPADLILLGITSSCSLAIGIKVIRPWRRGKGVAGVGVVGAL